MIVAVETNFILEIALQQPEANEAIAILQMAEAKEIQLVIPATAFAESYSVLSSQAKRRRKLHEELRVEMNQMARSQPFADLEQTSKNVTDALVSSATHHTNELVETANRIRACTQVIPLTKEVTLEMSYLDLLLGLESGDAFIYASIHEFLKGATERPRFFVTKDKDFKVAQDDLKKIDCQLIFGFGEALGAIKSKRIARSPGSR